MAEKNNVETSADDGGQVDDQRSEENEESSKDSSMSDDSQNQDGGSDDEGEGSDEDGSSDDDLEIGDDDEEPESRRDNSFWVGFRKGKKAAQDDSGADDSDEDGEPSDDGEDVDPNRKVIQEEVKKTLSPVAEKMMEEQDKKELNSYLSENPEFKPFEKKIERFMKHPSRQHLPVETVALEAVGRKNLMKIAAKKAQNADNKANKSKGGGSSTRNAGEGGKVWDESKDDFEKRKQKVRQKIN